MSHLSVIRILVSADVVYCKSHNISNVYSRGSSTCGPSTCAHVLGPHVLEPRVLEPHVLDPHVLEPATNILLP